MSAEPNGTQTTRAPRGRLRRGILIGIASALLIGTGLGAGCSTTTPRRNPVGEMLPRVTGEALTGVERTLPDHFLGEPVVLLVGYLQNSQFDIDRWILGITTLKTPVKLAEIPTIPGLAPTVFSGLIDSGMRRGIPRDDWAGVITLYGGDAKQIATLTGNEDGLAARVLLLDAAGRVVWFHDEGFSARVLQELDGKVRDLALPAR